MKLFKRRPNCQPSASQRAGSFASSVDSPYNVGVSLDETVHVDLSLFAGFGEEQQFSDNLLKHFEARISDAAEFARERRVLLLRSSKGVGMDVALSALPYEALLIQRASYFDYPPGIPLRTCSAEDLIVLKASRVGVRFGSMWKE